MAGPTLGERTPSAPLQASRSKRMHGIFTLADDAQFCVASTRQRDDPRGVFIGAGQQVGRFTPQQARVIARALLEAAEAAEFRSPPLDRFAGVAVEVPGGAA